MDLTVNILTNHAINNGKISVFGGEQKRPNLHIEDMTDVYLFLLEQPSEKINDRIFNVGYDNYKVKEIAEMKMEDLNAANVENAERMIEGTARSMGITIEG